MALHPQRKDCVSRVIEAMGEASAEAQGIPQAVTSMLKLKHSDQRVYLFVRDSAVLGLIKVGGKTLFIMRLGGEHCEISPLCLLDFYIHKGKQRQGLGKEFFDAVLRIEQTEAYTLAYDKPSKKSLAFLKRHYGLANYVPQASNFVVYEQYFERMFFF